jgi:AcrR family transcriptional regulator
MFEDPPVHADARRNALRVLDAPAELLAADALVSLEQVAAHARVSRTTLYHHFPSRDALLDALTDRSVSEVCAALQSARPDPEGAAAEAMDRTTKAAWHGGRSVPETGELGTPDLTALVRDSRRIGETELGVLGTRALVPRR